MDGTQRQQVRRVLNTYCSPLFRAEPYPTEFIAKLESVLADRRSSTHLYDFHDFDSAYSSERHAAFIRELATAMFHGSRVENFARRNLDQNFDYLNPQHRTLMVFSWTVNRDKYLIKITINRPNFLGYSAHFLKRTGNSDNLESDEDTDVEALTATLNYLHRRLSVLEQSLSLNTNSACTSFRRCRASTCST